MGSHVAERINLDLTGVDEVQRQLHSARYDFAAGLVTGKRVLDMACGTGYGTARLARGGASSVTGIDVDLAAAVLANARPDLGGARFAVGDAENPPVKGPFDVIVSFETIEHLQSPEQFLDAVRRLLAEGGTFIVSTPCRDGGTLQDQPRNPFHLREWNQSEFRELLGRHFRQVTVYGQLVEFAKNRVPLNRTMTRSLTALFTPQRMRNMYSYEVRPLEHLPRTRVRIHYQVAVCRT
jgi:2-polyprenyl-3-methyl-5-hydroxy-6-metoxy-1,4-benzoquinol methylase